MVRTVSMLTFPGEYSTWHIAACGVDSGARLASDDLAEVVALLHESGQLIESASVTHEVSSHLVHHVYRFVRPPAPLPPQVVMMHPSRCGCDALPR